MAPNRPDLAQLLFEEASLQEALTPVHLSDGEVLFRRGDPGDAFYIIRSGRVRIFTQDEKGQETTLNTLDTGDAFGELALLDGRPRSAGISAIGPTTLYRLSRDDFLKRVYNSPELTRAVIQLISTRVRDLTNYIEQLGKWARYIAQGQYDQVIVRIQQDTEQTSDRTLAAVAGEVQKMARAIQRREENLRRELTRLRIQINEAERQQRVSEIVDSEYFQHLYQQAQVLRQRRRE